MTVEMVVGSNPTSHTLRQRLWDLVTESLFLCDYEAFVIFISGVSSSYLAIHVYPHSEQAVIGPKSSL
jgi:hypothetical protein